MQAYDNEFFLRIKTLARTLGASHSLVSKPDKSIRAFKDIQVSVSEVRDNHAYLVSRVDKVRHVTYEIESIFDNFFVVESAIFGVESGMQKKDAGKLPLTVSRDGKEELRLFFILKALAEETNGVFDKDILTAFLSTYQEKAPLSIRELYAIIPVLQAILTIRFNGLIKHAVRSLDEYTEAERVYREVKKELKSPKKGFAKLAARLAAKYAIAPVGFGLALLERLSADGSAVRPIVRWVRLNFEKQGIDSKRLTDLLSEERNSNSLRAANIIQSLHWLTQTRWESIVKEINVVDQILYNDPTNAYERMQERSQEYYRESIVRIAERAGIHEAEVARTALKLAEKSSLRNVNLGVRAESHVGYYLIDKGRPELEREVGYAQTPGDRILRQILSHAEQFYFGTLSAISTIILGIGWIILDPNNLSLQIKILIGCATAFLSVEIGVNLLNALVTRFLPLRRLPRLDLSSGIEDDARTFVVVPSMFRNAEGIKDLARKLEVRYLGNRDSNLYFALLLDFKDASTAETEMDFSLVALMDDEISLLNKKYSPKSHKFFFLYRERKWNASEGVFMAWERKRGKLREWNDLMLGKAGTSFINEKHVLELPKFKYVITLDEDTELPKDAARRLVGSIHHPLNRPVIVNERVVRGFGIVQPRVSVRIATATKSLFARLFSATSGIDSYSSPVSDVYQDLFGSSIFFGKGIYDIEAIETSMKDKIPDNAVLSHDLLEGNYARVGFAGDIVIFDGFPDFYHEFMMRLERWIRGDWQIIGWILPNFLHKRAKKATGGWSMTDRFKIFDNLRRSLVPVVAFLVLFLTVIGHGNIAVVGLLVILVLAAPYLAALISDILSLKRIPFFIRLVDTFRQIISAFAHTSLRAIFLFHQAYVSIYAIVVTLFRMFISDKYLLRWNNAADVSTKLKGKLREYYRSMWATQIVSLPLILLTINREVDPAFTPWLVLWIVSPLIGYIVSSTKKEKEVFVKNDTRFLRRIAYRTSRFFLDLSRGENNWLIEDHLQEAPKKTIRERPTTSPTNIGMFLVSLLSARDFGYISIDELGSRMSKALASMMNLERYRGHFYNWYDIERLEVLQPKYVSAVDSSNLVVSLFAVKQGLEDSLSVPYVSKNDLDGIFDAVEVLLEESELAVNRVGASSTARRLVKSLLVTVRKLLSRIRVSNTPESVREAYDLFLSLHADAAHAERAIADLAIGDFLPDDDSLIFFVKKLASTIEDKLASILRIAPHVAIEDPSIRSYVFKNEDLFNAYENLIQATKPIVSFANYGEYVQKIQAIDLSKIAQESSLELPAVEHIVAWHKRFITELNRGHEHVRRVVKEIRNSADICEQFIQEADFSFLYDEEKGLFHIGYNAAFDKVDKACYNMLASEANLLSFVSIIKDQAPQKHWFYLSRKLVRSGNNVALMSWGGSLFEYLTSLVFLDVHPESLIGSTALASVREHIAYAKNKNVIWGMGESAYLSLDASKGYAYQVFGSPRLGLKRGLADYLVVAPYTSALSLQVLQTPAINNLRVLESAGARGQFGFYDAIDYMDESRVRGDKPQATKIYYAHHQGFLLASINNVLNNGVFKKRFHKDMRVRSVEILLEERMPDAPAALPLSPAARLPLADTASREDLTHAITYVPQKSPFPRYVFISNGDYGTAVSNSGAGWSRRGNVMLTRRKLDPVIDDVGSFIYIQDKNKGTIWSPTLRPSGQGVKGRKAVFHENKATFAGSMDGLNATLSVAVATNDPVEVRMVELVNTNKEEMHIAVASYSEISLASQADSDLNPHFQNMLVKAEYKKDRRALIFSRPHPSDRTKKVFFASWCPRTGFNDKAPNKVLSSRESFMGRYNSVSAPGALVNGVNEVHKDGHPLHPSASFIKNITLKPGERRHIIFAYGTSDSSEGIDKLIHKFGKERALLSVLLHADKESMRMTREAGIAQALAVDFQALASKIIAGSHMAEGELFPDSPLPYIHTLWRLGISGDYPIMIAVAKDIEDIQAVKHMLIAHAYLKSKGIEIDLVILNEEPTSYIKVLDDEVDFLIRQSRTGRMQENGGSVFHVKAELLSTSDKSVLLFMARTILSAEDKGVRQQVISALSSVQKKLPARIEISTPRVTKNIEIKLPEVSLFNGVGGFDEEKNEYVFTVSKSKPTPAPWAHIVANNVAGTVISETGAMFTWSVDSFDNRITVPKNDSVRAEHPEAFFIRDNETGDFWSPTPLPKPPQSDVLVRYGKGYAVFESASSEIQQSLDIFVAKDEPVKIMTLSLKNTGRRKRNLSVFSYFELALNAGRNEPKSDVEVFSMENGLVAARNRVRDQLSGRTVVFGTPGYISTVTTDRSEFIGINGSLRNPAALSRISLSNTFSSSDPCMAFSTSLTLLPGEEKIVSIVMADSENALNAEKLFNKFSKVDDRNRARVEVVSYWKKINSTIEIHTPDKALDVLVSHSLVYQTLAARVFARTGFFQPSGAIGFRDQLQDITALFWWDQDFSKKFIEYAASRQFKEGDAECWWHEHNGFGIRLVQSDHALWLVNAVLSYTNFTGDKAFWDNKISFLEGPKMTFAYQKEWAGIPLASVESGSMYEHCARAIEKSLVFGEHGLPLIGMSDWNDGLSRTGTQGKGESVWLAFFILKLIRELSPISKIRNDIARVELFERTRVSLEKSIEHEAWDGKWYRRAFMDSGLMLGSRRVKEFRIDSLAQSWATISGVDTDEHKEKAIRSGLSELTDNGIIRLISPALKDSSFDPGYIKDYPPGVRENGSQYNHAALWMAQALFIRGDSDGGKAILDMVNPYARTKTKSDLDIYRGEPYAVASDIYASPAPHGRAGWTWYTGAAGVMLKVVLESMFGLQIKGDSVSFAPHLPTSWSESTVIWRQETGQYTFRFKRGDIFGNQVISKSLDGKIIEGDSVPLTKDGKNHEIVITIGA